MATEFVPVNICQELSISTFNKCSQLHIHCKEGVFRLHFEPETSAFSDGQWGLVHKWVGVPVVLGFLTAEWAMGITGKA